MRLAAGKLAQRLDGLDHAIVEIRDRALLLQEEVTALIGEDANRHLNILSILATLFMPPTLITGIFAMNAIGLPFADNEEGFLWVSALMIDSTFMVFWIMPQIGVLRR